MARWRLGFDRPTTVCFDGTHATAWYRFKPTSTMYVRADTFGSTYDTQMAVYTGSSVSALTEVTCTWRPSAAGGTQSSLVGLAKKNVSYAIQVDSIAASPTGSRHFHLVKVTPPANDTFAGARHVGPRDRGDGASVWPRREPVTRDPYRAARTASFRAIMAEEELLACRARIAQLIESAAASAVVAMNDRPAVANCAHTKSGMRVSVMPGARIL